MSSYFEELNSDGSVEIFGFNREINGDFNLKTINPHSSEEVIIHTLKPSGGIRDNAIYIFHANVNDYRSMASATLVLLWNGVFGKDCSLMVQPSQFPHTGAEAASF